LREQAAQIAPCLLPHGPPTPGYFDVLANSINIMQDYITRARLAGEPPQVMLVPRLRHIGLMEFNRAKEAIAGGGRSTSRVQRSVPRRIRRAWFRI
jgi:NTE family protein